MPQTAHVWREELGVPVVAAHESTVRIDSGVAGAPARRRRPARLPPPERPAAATQSGHDARAQRRERGAQGRCASYSARSYRGRQQALRLGDDVAGRLGCVCVVPIFL